MSSVYEIERIVGYSEHTGMVFGQYVSDADRKPRTEGYNVTRDGKVVCRFRLRRQAAAYIARRLEAQEIHQAAIDRDNDRYIAQHVQRRSA